jgi:hypothetical protein
MTAHDKHIYNSRAWQRLRRRKLLEQPLCEPCEALGRLVPATVVDHRMPISSGGDALPISNSRPRRQAPILFRLALHRRRVRVLELEPVWRAAAPLAERHFSAGSITRSPRSAINCCWLL